MAVTLEATCLSVQLQDFPTGRTYVVTLQLPNGDPMSFYDPDPHFTPERTYTITIDEDPEEEPS